MTAPVLAIVDRAKNAVAAWNALVTSIYKLAGFVMLTLILVGLASYFALHVFYLVSDSWVAPVILSAHHDRVLQLSSHEIQQSHQRDQIRAERLSLLGQVEAAERSIALNEVFQQSFQTAMREELASREVLLADTAALERRHRTTLGAQAATDREFVREAESELEAQYAAGLIERSAYLQSKRGLAAIAHAEFAAHDRGVRLAASVRDSKREIDDMRGAIRPRGDGATGEAVLSGDLVRGDETLPLNTAVSLYHPGIVLEGSRLGPLAPQGALSLATALASEGPLRATLAEAEGLLAVLSEHLGMAELRQGHESLVRKLRPVPHLNVLTLGGVTKAVCTGASGCTWGIGWGSARLASVGCSSFAGCDGCVEGLLSAWSCGASGCVEGFASGCVEGLLSAWSCGAAGLSRNRSKDLSLTKRSPKT